MSEAPRDQNFVPAALGQSSTSATVTLPFIINSINGRLLTDSASGSGDVVGPASATDNAVVLFDGATGKLIKDSTIKSVTTVFSPTISDGNSLGSGTLMWSDLFLASGAVVNFNNGDVVLTHTAGVLTTTTGDLRVTTAGTNSASVVTVGGTQTLTNKTLTSPVLTAPSLGVATATSINGLVISTTTGTFTLTNGKTFAVTNGLTLSGTDSTVMTFPTTSATIARTDAANTFTGNQTFSGTVILGTQSITMTGSIAATGARVTKGWFTDVESTNMYTVGGTSLSSTFAPLASPTFTGTVTLPTVTANGVITLSENSSIALDPAGSADGKYTGITVTGVGGAVIAFGDLLYLDAGTSRWKLTDADAATTSDRMIGMAVTSSTDGGALTLLLQGIIRADAKFPALTIGSPVYVGETAGEIQVAIPVGADNVIKRVGFALTADEIYFNPSTDVQTTVA